MKNHPLPNISLMMDACVLYDTIDKQFNNDSFHEATANNMKHYLSVKTKQLRSGAAEQRGGTYIAVIATMVPCRLREWCSLARSPVPSDGPRDTRAAGAQSRATDDDDAKGTARLRANPLIS